MAKCRVLVHFNFKKGMEAKGTQFIEKDLFDYFFKNGSTGAELFQEAGNPTHYYYAVDWNSEADAKRVQGEWEKMTTELRSYCTNAPKREFYNLKYSKMEKARKAA